MAVRKVKHVEWRLWALMADRGIRSASELSDLLDERAGYKCSRAQSSRYTQDPPPALTIKFLSALLTTLDAKPEELFRVTEIEEVVPEQGQDKDQGSTESKARRTRVTGDRASPSAEKPKDPPRLFRLGVSESKRKP